MRLVETLPLYIQLARDLAQRIRKGEFEGDGPVPTEGRLCEHYGVSRITVRRALDDLVAQRLIVRRRGVGTFVAKPTPSQKAVSHVGSIHQALHYVQSLTYTPLARKEVEPPPHIAQALQLAAGERATYLRALGKVKQGPLVRADLYFPVDIGRMLSVEDLEPGVPIVHVLERKLGRSCVRAEQLVEPDVADSVTARMLGIKAGKLLLRIFRVYFLADGRPIEAAVTRYHPERYKLHIELVERPPV